MGPAAFAPSSTSLRRTSDWQCGHRKRMVFSSTHSMDSSLIHISLLQEGQGFTGIGILYVAHRAFGLLDQIGWQLRHLVGDHRMHLELGQDVIHRVAPHFESASLFEALQCLGHSEPSLSIRCVYLYPIR